TFGPDGKLYVVDLGATSFLGNILRFNTDGTFDQVYNQVNGSNQGSLLFQFPSDAVFDGQGNLLTANLGPAYPPALQGSIFKYDSTGTFSKTLVSSSAFSNTGPGTSGLSPSQLVFMTGVTVNQAVSQPDPTNAGPVHFTVVFSEPVTGFGSSGVVLGG